MDNSSYGYFDEILLKAGSVPPGSHHQPRPLNVDSLPFNPFINSTPGATMQISHSFYNTAAASKVKLEDMVLDLPSKSFQASVTQPYERAELGYITNLQSPPLGSDFRGLRSTPMPTFDVRDFIASCNSFNFLGGVEQTGAPVNHLVESSSFMNKLAMPLLNHGDSNVKRLHTRTPSLAPPSRVSNNNLFQALEHVHQEHDASKLLSPSTSRAFFGPSLADSVPASFKSVLDVPIHQFSPDNLLEKLICDSSNAPNSPSKQDSSALSSEELDIDWSKNEGQSTKRRKMQHKRVVCVAIGEGKQLKGEAPPADLWAWRKYGQKPIKGSPYPRGYYRCSSSKGCSARKQVERSATDPSVLVVTYTSDHNHALPTSKNTIGSAALASMTSLQDDNSEGQSKEGRSSSDVASENLFSSIINTVSSEDEQVVSSLDSLQDKETLCSLQSFPLRARTTGGDSDDEGVFDDLGELPEMSSTFNKGYLEVDLQQMQDGWFS